MDILNPFTNGKYAERTGFAMSLEKEKRFLIHLAYWIVLAVLIYTGLKYLLPLLLPFFIGYGIAFLLRSPIRALSKKLEWKSRFTAAALLILFYGLLAAGLFLAGSRLARSLQEILLSLPDFYKNTLNPLFSGISEWIKNVIPEVFSPWPLEDSAIRAEQALSALLDKGSQMAAGLAGTLAAKLPAIGIQLAFTVLSSLFFTLDYQNITNFILRACPSKIQRLLFSIKGSGCKTAGHLIKAYFLLMLLTFGELSAGLLLLKAEHAMTLAALISIVDILPVLGTGTVLVPWALLSFLQGDTRFGIGLLTLFVIISVVRNLLEPKIVGREIGLHPVVTLMSIYMGGKLFGFLGIFALPVLITILKDLWPAFRGRRTEDQHKTKPAKPVRNGPLSF